MKVTIIDKKDVMGFITSEQLYCIKSEIRKDNNTYCYLKKVSSLRIKEVNELLKVDNVTFILIES